MINVTLLEPHKLEEDGKLSWKLKLSSGAPLTVKNDTEREDLQAAIRASWENGQVGRSHKARKARDKFLKAKSTPDVLLKEISVEEMERLEAQRRKDLITFAEVREKQSKERHEERVKSSNLKTTSVNELEETRKQFFQTHQEDLQKRRELNEKLFPEANVDKESENKPRKDEREKKRREKAKHTIVE